uniref:Uncharacterized protein n=1 Tax=Aegilops tauschii subsp. strangulata TaxID=200361 RepID=A0A453R0W0_AEGTS
MLYELCINYSLCSGILVAGEILYKFCYVTNFLNFPFLPTRRLCSPLARLCSPLSRRLSSPHRLCTATSPATTSPTSPARRPPALPVTAVFLPPPLTPVVHSHPTSEVKL